MIHSCSYYCHKPECIKAQRDELRDKLFKREWVELTDEEMRQICGSVPAIREAVREALAKLKEKNSA